MRCRLRLAFVVALGCTFDTSGSAASGELMEGTSGGDTSTATSSVGTSGGPTSGTSGGTTAEATAGATTMGLETGRGTSTGIGTESSGGSDTTTGAFGCTNVLYVAGSTEIGAYDQPFYDVLVGLGAEITVVQGDLTIVSDADDMCLVVISASVGGSDVAGEFRDVAIPVVTWEYAIYDDMQMTGLEQGIDFGPADPEEDVSIVDDAHPMAAGLSGTLTVAEPAPGRLSWGVPGPAAVVVATLPEDSTRATLFGYTAGDMMVGLNAPAARVGFPSLTAPSGATINADGAALFEAALLWAVR